LLDIYKKTQFYKELVQLKIAEAYKDLLDSTVTEPVESSIAAEEHTPEGPSRKSLLTIMSVAIERSRVVDIHQLKVKLTPLSNEPLLDIFLKVSSPEAIFYKASTKVIAECHLQIRFQF
jgi:hypothetical protein